MENNFKYKILFKKLNSIQKILNDLKISKVKRNQWLTLAQKIRRSLECPYPLVFL